MAELIDWTILSNKPSLKQVIPDSKAYSYDLFNVTDSECLVYGERSGDNINLRWGDPGKSDNVRFQRASGSTDPIKFEELIAINIRKGGFLVYQRGRWGINLGWSETPKFEWKILGGKAGEVVVAGKPVGLYSTVEKDSLMYESRDWGINLKWFKDAGKYNDLSGLLKAGKIVKNVSDHVPK
ncbi:MAG: hypothetical protein ACJ74W_20295 [Pyrinomonadaceae bacterium]